jgi:hypothetical protein
MTFIMLKEFPFNPSVLRIFIMKECFILSQVQWYTTVIPATGETEARGLQVQGWPGQSKQHPISKQKGWEHG